VHEHARVHEQPRGEEEPEAERVQARERHVARADHQRDEVVAEGPDRHRNDEEEDHRHPVHGHQLVVGLRREHLLVRLRELRPHQQRLDPTGAEKRERGEEVEEPDPLVIRGRQPAEETPGLDPDPLEPLDAPEAGFRDRSHYLRPSR
jgi:hypothetical protein